MGLKEFILQKFQAAGTRTTPADPVSQVGFMNVLNQTLANVHVDHESAQQVSAVWACMDVIAAAIASTDWNVYEGVRGADKKKALPQDGLQYVLNTRWNTDMTAQAAKRAMMLCALSWGNGYAEIQRDMANRIVGLWPIHPDRVEPRRELGTGALFFRVFNAGGPHVDLDAADVFHIRGASLTGFVGDDAIRRAIRTIAIGLATDRFSEAYFGNNAQLGTVFLHKQRLDDIHFERLKKELRTKHAGVENAHRFALLDGNEWDIKKVAGTMAEAEMAALRALNIEEICRWFRVPPHKVAHLLRSTNNNIEHQGLEFTRDTLRPWSVEVQQEGDYKLLPARGPRRFIEFDLDWAEQGDYKSRMEAYSTGIFCGVFSPNDVLRKLGENTIGPVGDVRFVNGAAIKLEDIGQAYAQPAAPAAPKDPEEEPVEEDEPDDAADAVRTDWLTQVFSRVATYRDRLEADFEKAGRPHARVEARTKAAPYARKLVEELDFLREDGQRLLLANKWAAEVVGGCDPGIAAAIVMKKG